MAKLASLLFTRTLNQFLECEDPGSRKALALIQKIRDSAGQNVEKLMNTVTRVGEPHRGILTNICRESIEGFSEEFYLDQLSHDQTVYRVAASDILSHNTTIDTSKLWQRMYEPDARMGEILDVLRSQKHALKPEEIIRHALKLNSDFSVELLKMLEGSKQPVNLSMIHIHYDKIENDSIKVHLLTYLGRVKDKRVPGMVSRFLADPNKVVVLEALKTLDRYPLEFDATLVLSHIDNMSGINLELALKIISHHANAELIPHLSVYLNSRNEERNDFFARIIAEHADVENFENFLNRLRIEDDWDRQQSIVCVQKQAGEKLSEIARQLANHEQEYIRNTAQQLVINLLGDEDLEKIEEFALSDNWQVRERAIQSLAKSSNRGAIAILKKLVDLYPDDFVLALRAVRQLGFGKGLEIAFDALKQTQANIQRAGLETIGEIVTDKHAQNARDNLLWKLPGVTEELQEYAKQLITRITKDYGLEDVQLDAHTDTARSIDIVDINVDPDPQPVPEQTSPLDKLKPGSVWMDRYHIKEEIGRGAMGRVMLVEDDMVDESLVLKLMLPRTTIDEGSTERFKREVKYARRVSHRNVIRVHDLLLKDGICAISMEFFKSRGLEEILNTRSCFETRDGLKILYQISSGMTAAHMEGVVHRDLKPSNILINNEGQVKIVDFGIASVGTGASTTLTGTGAIIGSPAYLAPERAMGVESDVRSDIYSLGVIAYYMFGGQLPYSGKPLEVIEQHRDGNAPPITKINESASAQVSRLIVRMMAVQPEARPQTMAEVRDAVKALLDAEASPSE